MRQEILKKVEFEFGQVAFYKWHLHLELAKEEHLSVNRFVEVLRQKMQICGSRKIFFLSLRKYPSSFDPTVFVAQKQQIKKNFLALLIVSNRYSDYFEENYVKKMCPVESHYFTSLQKALGWMETYISKLENPIF